MKQLIILLGIFFSLNIYSQNYEDDYKEDICGCIKTNTSTYETAENIYNACFTKHMTTYATFIDAAIKENDKTKKFITGQKVRRELQEKFK